MSKGIVVFGSTGNLMYKKLIPAIDALIQKKHLKENDRIFCVGRRDYSLNDYIENAKKEVSKDIDWSQITPYLEYFKMDIDDQSRYNALNEKLQENTIDDLMIYLAVPPTLFPVIAKGVNQSKMIEKGNDMKRIVFEKPFGEDLESAKAINQKLWTYFDESQIYRIDHYLGKEMIQNILIVRFANWIFDHAWNNESIENVLIIAKETEGVLSRGNYYDKIGALKDMLQSHLLQMISLVAMERPKSYQSNDIKDKKVQVFKDLKIVPKDVIYGQYKGYVEEEKVDDESLTETFVFGEVSINNDRFKGVPFYFLTGKKLDEKRSEIIINFKSVIKGNDLWPNMTNLSNQLRIEVAPQEGVRFQFNIKEPSLSDKIIPAKLDYCHNCRALENSPEAYEKLLLDLINKNKTLFTRWDEIEATWEIVQRLYKTNKQLYTYDSYEDMKDVIKEQFGEDFDDL
jgi:glucose-6-phosphate 1-dehydrogenase